jgi:flagellar assembly protein FliH
VRPFRYRTVGGGEDDQPNSNRNTKLAAAAERRKENIEAIRRVLEAEFQVREKRAREEGIKEGQLALRGEVDRTVAAIRDALALAVKQFALEREDYFRRVEGHVVKLALAIARRILYREAQIDPLFLAGAVRVALDKISSATMIRLYVHPDQVSDWEEFLARQSDLRQRPDVLGDTAVAEGQCRIESSLGAADLSLENQVMEIERGFLDLLAQRPDIP